MDKSYGRISYFSEISSMMSGFGDSLNPNEDTVRLVESIVLKQLRTMIYEAARSADICEANVQQIIRGEDLVFLLRNSKRKMRRFLKYLLNKDVKREAEQAKSGQINLAGPMPKNSLISFIQMLDETGELTDVDAYDSVKQDRMIRAERLSQALNEEKYLEYHKARCASFNSRELSKVENRKRLKAWIDPDGEISLSENSHDVLAYIAFETVAQMVDLAFLLRQDCKRTSYNPLGMLAGNYSAAAFSSPHFPEAKPEITMQPALTVAEVQEAARRIFMPQVGSWKFGGKVPDSKRLMAC